MSSPGPKISFFGKEKITCPVCEAEFAREEILSGGGRLNAAELTPELRRNYTPTEKYGEVVPLIYAVTVCPNCLYAAFSPDFADTEDDDIAALNEAAGERQRQVGLLFDDVDFLSNRGLHEGLASYHLALMCYDLVALTKSPTFKRGLCGLRAAWLCGDLHRMEPGENWDYVQRLYYRKARFFFSISLDLEQAGNEKLDGVQSFGPDVDKNYGFEGFVYLAGLLEFRYGPRKDSERRVGSLEKARMAASRVFGFGKSSKERPTPILNHARDMFELMSQELEELRAS